MNTVYSLFGGSADGMKRIDVPENSEKNNMKPGRILQLNGYSNPQYIIIENQGIDKSFPHYGARYNCIDPKALTYSIHNAYTMKHISEKKNDMIQLYLTDDSVSADKVLELKRLADDKAKHLQEQQEAKEIELKEFEVKGRELFKKYIPENVKALIVAIEEIDDCDLMTDYVNTKYGEKVVLGYSFHNKDIFSEMRKVAHLISETEHLSKEPDVNTNGEKKTEDNKKWWHPSDEHREKHFMGAGYYLKATGRYSTGWKIEKVTKWHDAWDSGLYISLAKRCVFKVSSQKESEKVEKFSDIVIRKNEDKNGLEIIFPEKPSAEIRTWLKSHSFRWSKFNGLWYTRYSESIYGQAKLYFKVQ